jgi:hypothetical protein
VTAGAEEASRRSVLRRALSMLDAFEYRDRDVSLAELTSGPITPGQALPSMR